MLRHLQGLLLAALITVVHCDERCFQDREELVLAVNDYLKDNGPSTQVAKSYGWPIGAWCVSQVKDFRGIFENATDFNEDLSQWNTSAAISMASMFSMAPSFNRPLSSWDVSSVEDMRYMFLGALSFNQDLSSWNVSNVRSMKSMFFGASEFNGDVTTWNVEKCLDMRALFFGATSFNRDVSKWNVSHRADTDDMFLDAISFRQNLCGWGSKLTEKRRGHQMFEGTSCPLLDDPDWLSAPSGPFCFPCHQLSAQTSPQDSLLRLPQSVSVSPVVLLLLVILSAMAVLLRRGRESSPDIDPSRYRLHEFELLQILEA